MTFITNTSYVKCNDLSPVQQITSLKFRKSCNFFYQQMLKHDQLSEFHSHAEFCHAVLLEADKQVKNFVPQPFKLIVFGKPYVPDAYVNHFERDIVVELKPKGIFDGKKQQALEDFFKLNHMEFRVIANEDVEYRKSELHSWLDIIRTLVLAADLNTEHEEKIILSNFNRSVHLQLMDLIDPLARENNFGVEVGLFRLIHKGHLVADFEKHRLNYDTWISKCD